MVTSTFDTFIGKNSRSIYKKGGLETSKIMRENTVLHEKVHNRRSHFCLFINLYKKRYRMWKEKNV